MLRSRSLALMLALAGCSTPSKPPTSTSGTTGVSQTGGGGDDGGTSGSSCSFASSPTAFALPTLANAPASPFPLLDDSASCATGTSKLTYSLVDMNADGQPDLLVTSACDDASVGATKWLVYMNDGSGFATTPIDFALPPAPPSAGCATTALFDIDGDLLPDYVETSLCDDATVGTSRWLVYPNIKTGFAQASVPYVLPPGYSTGAFISDSAAVDTCTGGKNLPAFAVFDLDGDAYVDFVMTQSCTDPTVGTAGWKVYLGGQSGAAQTAATFALPTTPTVTAGAFDSPSGVLSCTASATRPSYDLVDWNVDGKPDLVVTAECSDASVGTSAWLWYGNSGQGFAASPATIALPTFAGAPGGSFTSLAGAGQCANGAGAPTYSLTDIDGNTVLDLLVTRDCGDLLTGISYWEVFENVAGAGFTSPRRKLMLPAALGATSTSPAGLSGVLDCTSPPRPTYTTAYLAGLELDIVGTAACADPAVGDTEWLLFSPTCP